MPRIEYIVGFDHAIGVLTQAKLIVSLKHRAGYLVSRYGVNKSALKKAATKLNGR